jgi:tagatose-6-phosphate ketose/aldose isomerase
MDVFGLSAEQIDSAGAHWTAREICQQPQIWLEVERLMADEAGRLNRFLAPLLAQPDVRIVLSGAGTSSFVGECLAPAMVRYGRRVGHLDDGPRRGPQSWLSQPRLRCWCPSRDRAAARSVAALELADQTGALLPPRRDLQRGRRPLQAHTGYEERLCHRAA